MHIKEQKKELRKRIKELKKAVSAGELKRQSGIIQEKIINSEYFKNSEHILLYWALPDEADTPDVHSIALSPGSPRPPWPTAQWYKTAFCHPPHLP